MSVLQSAIAETDWVEVGKEGEPQNGGFTITREVTDIEQQTADTLYTTALGTKTVTDPKVRGQAYTGKFIVSMLSSKEDALVRGIIRQQLTKVTVITTPFLPSEDSWQLVEIKGSPDSNVFGLQIVREVKFLDPSTMKDVVAALLAVESYDGIVGGATSPKADAVLWPYYFINSSVDPRKEKDETVTIRQVLTRILTYATESVANTPKEADWILVGHSGTPDDAGYTLTRECRWINPAVAQATFLVVQGTASYSGPKADNVARSGTFWNSKVEPVTRDDRTVTLRQTLTLTASATSESTAKLVRFGGTPDSDATTGTVIAAGGVQLVRQWRFIDPTAADALAIALNAVESYDGITVTPTSPYADGQLYPYYFVNSDVRADKQADGTVTITQALTKVLRTTEESVALLAEVQGEPDSAGYAITREWPFIDPTAADSLFTTLLAVATYTNPKADDEAYTGTFLNSRVQSIRKDDRTVTIRQTVVLLSADVDEADSVMVSVQGDPDTAGYTITREWRNIAPASADTLFTTLNAVETYSNPQADEQAYTGTFWHAQVQSIKQTDGTVTIRQTIILTSSDLDEADARLVGFVGDPQIAGSRMTREWKWLLPTAADTLYTSALGTTSVTDPKADNQAFTGTFAVATLAPIKEPDGTVTIRQVLTKVTAITAYTDLAALTPRVKRGKEKVNPETFTGWQSDLETCELTYLNLTVGSLAVLNTVATVTDANLETEANDNADTQTWKIRQRVFTKNEDNTGTFICTFIEKNYVAFNASNFKTTSITDPAGFISTGTVGKGVESTVKGLDVANVATDIAAVSATSGYAIDKIVARIDGAEVTLVREETAVDAYLNLAPTQITKRFPVGKSEDQIVCVWRNVARASVATVYAAAIIEGNYFTPWGITTTNHKLLEVDVRHRGRGDADIVATLVIPNAQWTTDSVKVDVFPHYEGRFQTKTITTAPGTTTDYYRWVLWTRVSRASYAYEDAQSFQQGTGWDATPWNTDARFAATATWAAARLKRLKGGIDSKRLSNGTQVYESWHNIFYQAQAWTTGSSF